MFKHGFFHADSHPGNLLALPDGGLGLLDFGLTKRFSPEFLAGFRTGTRGISTGDQDSMIWGWRPLASASGMMATKESLPSLISFVRRPTRRLITIEIFSGELPKLGYRRGAAIHRRRSRANSHSPLASLAFCSV